MLHPKAISKIENKIKGTLINCYIENNWPQYDSFAVHLKSLSDEVIKHKKEWIDHLDIYLIFYDMVYEAIKEKVDAGDKLNGNIWDILGERKSNSLTEDIKDYIISIPRSYNIYIPLINNLEDQPENIELSKEISLIIFKDESQIPGGYSTGLFRFNKLQPNTIYFRQYLTGYIGKRLESICLKRVIGNFKVLLHQAIFLKLFKPISPMVGALTMAAFRNHYHIRKISVISEDLTNESYKLVETELPFDFSKFLNNIYFNFENDYLKKAKEKGKFEIAIASILKKVVQLIECEADETKRVKSAIEWCFNSYIVENQTMAFLQICIGLEALLGDDISISPLVETLADRCSYLVSPDIKGRKSLKDQFKKIYKIRSKLIHGNVLELNSEQMNNLYFGREILEYAITKEINHLNLGK